MGARGNSAGISGWTCPKLVSRWKVDTCRLRLFFLLDMNLGVVVAAPLGAETVSSEVAMWKLAFGVGAVAVLPAIAWRTLARRVQLLVVQAAGVMVLVGAVGVVLYSVVGVGLAACVVVSADPMCARNGRGMGAAAVAGIVVVAVAGACAWLCTQDLDARGDSDHDDDAVFQLV